VAALLDTSVAIHLRDGDMFVDRLEPFGAANLSIVSRVELENGVYRDPGWVAARRDALEAMLLGISTLPFDETALGAYRSIVASIGYSRARVLDRMIAATALVHGLTLITINGRDFADVPGLDLEVWSSP
jgi:tRNA(fMet)-specific endonuclease VapC